MGSKFLEAGVKENAPNSGHCWEVWQTDLVFYRQVPSQMQFVRFQGFGTLDYIFTPCSCRGFKAYMIGAALQFGWIDNLIKKITNRM